MAAEPRRTSFDVLFLLLGLPLALVSFLYVFVVLYLGTALSLTVIGLPLLAAGLRGGRQLGRLHRRMVRGLLDERIGEPAALERSDGVVTWTRSALTDAVSWRAMTYLALRMPLAVLGLLAVVGLPVAGLWLISFPLVARWLAPDGEGWSAWTYALEIPAGCVLLFATPLLVRTTGRLDRRLARQLLGPSPGSQRLGELRQARSNLAAENTRSLRWIERDLHDGTQAELVAIAMTLSLAEDELLANPSTGRLPELLDRARRQTDGAIAGLRRITTGINPVALDGGLDAALPTLIASCSIPVDFDLTIGKDDRPDPVIERVIYYFVAELLTNITKHSGARQARISVLLQDGRARVTVADDGRGGARARSDDGTGGGTGTGGDTGTGLAGLAERLAAVDGTIRIMSTPGAGTTVTAELPTRL